MKVAKVGQIPVFPHVEAFWDVTQLILATLAIITPQFLLVCGFFVEEKQFPGSRLEVNFFVETVKRMARKLKLLKSSLQKHKNEVLDNPEVRELRTFGDISN